MEVNQCEKSPKSRDGNLKKKQNKLPELSSTFFCCIPAACLVFPNWAFFFFFAFSSRVEFQNKFYSGQGFKFLPFTFQFILDGRVEEWGARPAISLVSCVFVVLNSNCCECVCERVSVWDAVFFFFGLISNSFLIPFLNVELVLRNDSSYTQSC